MTPRRSSLLLLAACTRGGLAAWTGMLGLEFASDRPTETKSLHCPAGFITGIRVRYGRHAQHPARDPQRPNARDGSRRLSPKP